MKLSIRMKIFLPVMVILIVFPLAVWLMFRYTLNVHMNYNTRKELEQAAAETEEFLSEDHSQEGEYEALEGLKEEFGGRYHEMRVMAVNGGYRVLIPNNYDDQPEMTSLYTIFLTEATGAENSWESGKIVEETIGTGRYLLYYRFVEEAGPEEVKYLILYRPFYDTSPILDQVSRFVLIIMAAMAIVSIVLFWFVAGSISGPVRRLCEAARGIGEKKFKKVETGATVKELCQLEDEINQMQEKLSLADQTERTFFQNASHELRTPLMSISGYAQGIQCGVFENVSQAAGIILEESTRLTEVVDGILTLTRMDQLRYQMVPVEKELAGFLKDRLELLEGFAYSQNRELVFEASEKCTVITDVMLLERAFSNVVSNCIRYAGKKVTVSLMPLENGVKIVVKDDGPGISPEEAEHIFDRFYKGKNGTHGLGLAIARCSMEYMGGSVYGVSSESGAVFEMVLPQDCRSFAPAENREI